MAPSDTIPLPPLPPPAVPAPTAGPAGRVDSSSPGRLGLILVLLVSALAFLLALFPARNSDLWMHLAAGRARGEDLARGVFSLGTDFPAGRTWLYDLVCYGLYSALGGPGLVLVKALLVVGLALVVLRLSRAGPGWCVPAACTCLALLAMSTRLLLQPATVSYLLLALTLWALRPRGDAAAHRPPLLLPPWPLLVLFVVWVNVDGWFVLGLATVALVWLGEVLDLARGVDGPSANQGRPGLASSLARFAGSLAVLAAACLLNPSHVRAFALPPELAGLGAALAPDRVTSPFQIAYLAHHGWGPAVLAYFPLLGLGLLSFFLNLPRWHWSRFLPWLGLALLSAAQAKAVPFFAVVAGPVLAWNLQEFIARRSRASRPRDGDAPEGVPLHRPPRREFAAGRALTVASGLVLLVCAWPGWLQAPPYEPRRWGVETAPALQRGAETARRRHQEGRLRTDTRALHLSPETAHAFAWFCPEERGLLDAPLAAAVRGEPGAPDDWRERMRAARVNRVILYDADRDRLFATLERLLAEPREWPLLYLEGDLAVFGWRDPDAAADPFRDSELDLERLAFRPAPDKKAPPAPPEEAGRRRWWEAFWKPAPPRSVDADEAMLHLIHAEVLRRSALPRHGAAWDGSQAASFVGAAAGWAGPGGLVDARVRLTLLRPQLPVPGSAPDDLPALDRQVHAVQRRFLLRRDDTPPALLYLAVRAARRGLAADPGDARAHLVLGESYLRLLHGTRERAWAERMPYLVQLRRAQASAALNRAVALKPDLAQAHLSLGGLYRELGYLDLALQHLRTYLRLARKAPPRGADPAVFREQADQFQEELDRLAGEVREREKEYGEKSAGARVLDRALLAVDKGLAGKARDLLLASDLAAFGARGMELELELLLRTGRPWEVQEWTTPAHRASLGAPAYHWLRAQALAASGDYLGAGEECADLARTSGQGDAGTGPLWLGGAIALTIGQGVLDANPVGRSLPDELARVVGQAETHARVAGLVDALRQEADATVLRGLLALEEGEVGEAADAFRKALTVWREDPTAGGRLDFNGRVIAQDCLRWLE